VIRFTLAIWTQHAATFAKVQILDELFVLGSNPLIRTSSFGVSFYFFYIPAYIPYLTLGLFNVRYDFLLSLLFRVPPAIGDIITFYALFSIGTHFSKDIKTGLAVGTVYFLNPYAIWLSSIVGHAESLMIGFVLLASVYLLKQKTLHSSVTFAFASMFRYLPVLILPFFAAYTWKRSRSEMAKFLAVYIVTIAVLAIPDLLSFATIYSNSPSGFEAFMQHFIGSGSAVAGTGHYPLMQIKQFTYNFTGILATLGLWPQVKVFFGFRNFLILYFAIVLFSLKYKSAFSFQGINKSVIAIFCLLLIFTPLIQHQYLMWVFPFILLEAYLFRSIPRFIPKVLYLTLLLIDPIIEGSFFNYFDATIPSPIRQNQWPLRNITLELSLSALHVLTLVATVIIVLLLIRSMGSKTDEEQTNY
jgi:Gpi18-like mannosyltransferase